MAVEQDMVNGLLADVYKLDEDYLLQLRSDAIHSVKKTNGQLSLEQHAQKKLEDDGVILKYAAIVNPEKTGEDKDVVRAEIQLQVTPEREHGFDALADRIYRFPQVKSLFLMSGGYDFKVIVEGDSLQNVALFVSSKLATLEGVRSTKTSFILKTYKENDIIYVQSERDRREAQA